MTRRLFAVIIILLLAFGVWLFTVPAEGAKKEPVHITVVGESELFLNSFTAYPWEQVTSNFWKTAQGGKKVVVTFVPPPTEAPCTLTLETRVFFWPAENKGYAGMLWWLDAPDVEDTPTEWAEIISSDRKVMWDWGMREGGALARRARGAILKYCGGENE